MANQTSLDDDVPVSKELAAKNGTTNPGDDEVDEELPVVPDFDGEDENRNDSFLPMSSSSESVVEQALINDNGNDGNNNIPFAGAIANLCSATLGAGVLSLPFALYQAGWIFGFLLLFLAAGSSVISIRFLVDASSHYQVYTYEGLVERGLGPTAKRLSEFCLIIFCVGCAVAYVIAVGDILNPIVPLLDRKYVIIGIWCIAMLPLSLLRRMESLQWASSIGVASIGTLMVAVLVHYWEDPSAPSIEADLSQLLWPASSDNSSAVVSVLRAFPIFVFAFSCQVNVCPIFDELPTPRFSSQEDKKHLMYKVVTSSVGLCGVLYAMIASTAALDFATYVQPNVLVNYCPVGIMQVAFGCMALAVVMAFPLNVFPARVVLEGIFWSNANDNDNGINDHEQTTQAAELREPLLVPPHDGSTVDESYRYDFAPVDGPIDTSIIHGIDECNGRNETTMTDGVPREFGARHLHEEIVIDDSDEVTSISAADETKLQQLRHFVLSIAISGFALALALIVPDISVVFGLLGGTTSSILGFILPGLLGKSLPGMKRSVQAWLLIIGGAIIGVLTTTVTIWTTAAASSATPANHVPDACDTDAITPTSSPT